MKVFLLRAAPLFFVANAIRMSRDITEQSDTIYVGNDTWKLGQKDFELILRVGCQYKHFSVLEQAVMWWEIDGISRGCLQELVRHRTSRLTVKSSRYTLSKELAFETKIDEKNAEKYLVLSKNEETNKVAIQQLELLRQLIYKGDIKNDIAKIAQPESFKTKLQWQIDLRNFINFYKLRSAKSAHWEIRELANKLFDSLDKQYQMIITEAIEE